MINRKSKYITPITKEEWEELTQASPQARVEACSPLYVKGFSRYYAYYHSQDIKYKFSQQHYDIFESIWIIMQNQKHLKPKYKSDVEISEEDKGLSELAIVAYREFGKTSIIKALTEYMICYDLRDYINVESRSDSNAERILYDIRAQLQTNQRIIQDFGELYNSKKSKEESVQKRLKDFVTNPIYNKDKVKIEGSGKIRCEAHTTGSSVRGRQHNSQRPDYLWSDDFEDLTSVASLAETEKVDKHLQEFRGGLSQEGAIVIYTGNYLSDFGNVAKLIGRSKNSKTISAFFLPIYEGEFGEGIIQWKERYCWYRDEEAGKISIESIIERLKDEEEGDDNEMKNIKAQATFQREMLLQPIDFTKQTFKKEMFRYISWEDLQYKNTSLYVIIDAGGSSKETQLKKEGIIDDTGIVWIYVDELNNWYVKSEGRPMDAKEVLEYIFNVDTTAKNLEGIYIEKTMFVEALQPFYKEYSKARNQYPRLRYVETGGRNKENRIRGLQPKYEGGAIYHIKGENNKLEDQLLRFPKLKHDDVLDALSYGLDVVRAKRIDNDPVKMRQMYDIYGQDDNNPFAIIGG
jgi:hypothetical protein